MNIPNGQFPLFLPFYIVAMWLGVGFVVSRMGWCGFAQKYAASSRPPGRSFNCRSAWFGTIFASYRNVMRVVFSDAGIYIYPLFLFRAFHRPFLVPWDKVVGVSRKERFWITWTELEVRDGTGEIHIMLSEDALREYRRFGNAEG
jgi:hypothetical protein